jgi:archaeosine synthase beta-subunit
MEKSMSAASVGITDLKRRLTRISREVRTVRAEALPPEPRYVDYDVTLTTNGTPLRRKKVILMSGGCSVPTCSMCPFTNENNYGLGFNAQTLTEQVVDVLTRTPDEPPYEVIALYNDGSFFAPREVPDDTQAEIARLVARAQVSTLVVESLPQFIRAERVKRMVDELDGVHLEVGIGLQSADDIVRELLVNTTFSRKTFERAVDALRASGAEPKIYVMLKPPFLHEDEAVEDVLATVQYLTSLGVSNTTLCPTRVAGGTIAQALFDKQEFEPPNVWTIVEAVRAIQPHTTARVAIVNVRSDDFDATVPVGCPDCTEQVIDALLEYSTSQELSVLPPRCSCAPSVPRVRADGDELMQRVASFVNEFEDARLVLA